jgi:hypothetical protein
LAQDFSGYSQTKLLKAVPTEAVQVVHHFAHKRFLPDFLGYQLGGRGRDSASVPDHRPRSSQFLSTPQ